MNEELACQSVVELLTEYLSGAMNPGDRARLEEHLRSCEPCTTYLEQLRASITLTGALARGQPPPVSEELLLLFRRWKK